MTRAVLRDTSTDSQEMLALLRQFQVDSLQLLDQVRPRLDQRQAVGVNAKGDDQKLFDVATDEWIRQWLSEHFESGLVESEEQTGAFEFGSGEQGYRFIVDPVDGSDNFERGLPLSAISLAMLPRQTSLSTDGVHSPRAPPVENGGSPSHGPAAQVPLLLEHAFHPSIVFLADRVHGPSTVGGFSDDARPRWGLCRSSEPCEGHPTR